MYEICLIYKLQIIINDGLVFTLFFLQLLQTLIKILYVNYQYYYILISTSMTSTLQSKLADTQLQITHNPYKTTSALQENCLLKAMFSYAAGGALGFVMAMFMNAVEMRQIQLGKIRRSTAIVFRKDFRRIFSTAKGFASFGFFLVLYECMMQHMRVKDDGTNSFLAGFATSVVLGANVMKRKQLIWSGIGGGFMMYGFYKVFKWFGF